MEFLGHTVGDGCMAIPEKRVEALAGYATPTTKRGLRSFLGAISLYRRYVDLLASDTAVLHQSWLLRKCSGWRQWNQPFIIYVSVFQIPIPLPEDVMSIVTDASGLGIGGVLQVCGTSAGPHQQAQASTND